MGIHKLEWKLRRRFIGKYCKVSGEVNSDFKPVDFKKVVDIVEVFGPPSAWYWQAKLMFYDGTLSNWFERMRDVEILTEK